MKKNLQHVEMKMETGKLFDKVVTKFQNNWKNKDCRQYSHKKRYE